MLFSYRTICHLSVALTCILSSAAASADASEQEAIQAQLAGALASADYAKQKCPLLTVDQDKINSLLKRSGKTLVELKASEDYAEQREVIAELAKSPQAALICFALSKAHGGYARGVILEK